MGIRPLAVALVGFVSFSAGAWAQTPGVRVLASNGIRAVFQDLAPKTDADFNSSTVLKQKIDAGEAFDVAIVTSDMMDTLVKEGKIAAGSRVELARAGVGVGIRKGAAKPDIRTAAAIKQTLLKAKSITYADDGASKVYVIKMLERLGIADEIGKKTMREQGSGRATARVADGSAELVLTLTSEILPVPGIELVGPLPAEFQNYIGFSAGVGAKAKNPEGGKALIQVLAGPGNEGKYKAKGMEALKK